jgi:hypothetical protein
MRDRRHVHIAQLVATIPKVTGKISLLEHLLETPERCSNAAYRSHLTYSNYFIKKRQPNGQHHAS